MPEIFLKPPVGKGNQDQRTAKSGASEKKRHRQRDEEEKHKRSNHEVSEGWSSWDAARTSSL